MRQTADGGYTSGDVGVVRPALAPLDELTQLPQAPGATLLVTASSGLTLEFAECGRGLVERVYLRHTRTLCEYDHSGHEGVRRMPHVLLRYASLALALLPEDLPAQADSSAAPLASPAVRVMQRLRADGVPGEAGFALRGFRGEWTIRQQDELADSLTAFILSRPTPVGRDDDAGIAAFETLFAATLAEGYGVPYRNAGIWMKRIAESDGSGYVNNAVSTIALALPDRREARLLLEDLARHPGPAATYAVQHLASAFGEPGVDAVRQLHAQGSAGTPEARRIADYVVRHGGTDRSAAPEFPTQADTSAEAATAWAAHVMRRIRIEGVSGPALFVLRSFRGEWTRQQQDAVADSLAAFVIDRRPDDRFESISPALGTLSLAARADGYGTPYAGAGERLRRIVESDAVGFSGGAMNAILHLADSTETLRILEYLARSPGPSAELAVQQLEARVGEAGHAILRRLHAEASAGTPRARAIISWMAERYGWVDPELTHTSSRTECT